MEAIKQKFKLKSEVVAAEIKDLLKEHGNKDRPLEFTIVIFDIDNTLT